MEDKIDILLATYNGEKYVAEQIESILNQSYRNIQLIISDDCSTDKTRDILDKYQKKDSRIKIYYQEENLGYIKNFEFLLKQAENKYYMLSDQDDYWLEEKVEKSLERLKQDDSDLVFADLEVVNQNLETKYPSFNKFMLLTKKIEKCKNSYEMNYLYNCVTGCTILAKKSTIDKILPIPTDSRYVAHDFWMALMISINGKVSYISEKYIKYRQHGQNQIGTTKISHSLKNLDDIRKLLIDVKLGVFGTYVSYNARFPEFLQALNEEAYKYFEMLKNKKNVNLKGWRTFHKLYKNESFLYYIENFLIMNLPCLGRFLFKIRYRILKILKKR